MSIKMPITKEKIRNHFHYGKWMYLLLAIIALMGWNLIYTTTRYRPPENLKVEFYADGYVDAAHQEKLDALMETIRADAIPDMEEVSCTSMGFDETYGEMQFMVWVSAGQGDVYLLTKERFDYITSDGAMMDLQPMLDEGVLHADGIDLTAGYARDPETGKKMLCGIPADSFAGLKDYGLETDGMVFCVLNFGQNDENSLKFLDYLLVHMRVDSAEPTTEATAEPTVVPTVELTAEPTVEPTAEPTAEPTEQPSSEPVSESNP